MIAVISPAKSLDFAGDLPRSAQSDIRFPNRTARLVSGLDNMPRKRLKKIMPVSDALIDLNRARYRDYAEAPERAAIHAFNGDVYTGFEASSVDDDAMAFAQDHLRILSGLYGLLRPLDPIRPHRLEMGTRWAPRMKRLTDYWKDRIAGALTDDLKAVGGDTIVNLASNEYWAAVGPHLAGTKVRVVNVDFRSEGPDGPRFVSFEAKRARGMMARYICENHVTDIAALTGFDSDGYRFVADGDACSDDGGATLRFVRS